jgi:hypothetical protein
MKCADKRPCNWLLGSTILLSLDFIIFILHEGLKIDIESPARIQAPTSMKRWELSA